MRIRVLVVTAAAIVATVAAVAGGGAASAGTSPALPNVVIIQTDDQTLDSMKFMPKTRALIGDEGATFLNHYANWPVCCPSRATMQTGQYSHNHGVLGNSPPEGSYSAFDTANTLALWLQARGYVTAHIGKFLNGYGGGDEAAQTEVPPGWSEWDTGTAGTTQLVYDYTQNVNGVLVPHGQAETDFKQDFYTDRAIELIGQYTAGSVPLYLQLDYTAPHGGGPNPNPLPPDDCGGGPKPAPRHATAFDTEPLPEPQGFNEVDVTDKPQAIQNLPLMTEQEIATITRRYRCRIESLLSVDEGVEEIIGALEAAGALDNTYVLFTSDNGFFHGEHRVQTGKSRVYEPSVRLPLLMRGPDVPANVDVRDLTINADLATTVVDVSGATPTVALDGLSLLPAVLRPWIERGRELLLETNLYSAVHTQRYVYAEYTTGEKELYDLRLDPFQLQSRHADPAYDDVRQRLVTRLAALRTCAGVSCTRTPGLRLRVQSKHKRQNGHRCSQPPVDVSVLGDEAGGLVEAEFFARGDLIATDRSAPFARKLRRHDLQGQGLAPIRVRASLIDGRRMGWERELRICR